MINSLLILPFANPMSNRQRIQMASNSALSLQHWLGHTQMFVRSHCSKMVRSHPRIQHSGISRSALPKALDMYSVESSGYLLEKKIYATAPSQTTSSRPVASFNVLTAFYWFTATTLSRASRYHIPLQSVFLRLYSTLSTKTSNRIM